MIPGSVLLSGFAFSLSLIVAIGAQNAFVLRQGLLGRHVVPVVGICVLSDVVLMSLGIAGVGAMVDAVPAILTVVTIAGVVFLLTYGALAARRVMNPGSLQIEQHDVRTPLLATAAACVAITWLNPHVYLDTVVLLGSVANSRGPNRWWFGAGAMFASLIWFALLGFGARFLRPLFTHVRAWQVLDALIALCMLAIAAVLVMRLV